MLTGPFFAQARATTLQLLQQTGSTRTLDAGRSLFHEGDPASEFVVILEGTVRVWRTSANGATVTVHMLGPGDLPGCVAVFRRIAYPATATAVDRVTIISWPAERISAFLRDDPALAANALDIVGSRNGEMLERLLEVSTQGVEQRLARALLRLVYRLPATSGEDAVEVQASRQDLAELTAATVHTVSRFISRWESEGIVSGGRGRIVVKNRAKLAGLAGSD